LQRTADDEIVKMMMAVTSADAIDEEYKYNSLTPCLFQEYSSSAVMMKSNDVSRPER
jgi:hypothetical protein